MTSRLSAYDKDTNSCGIKAANLLGQKPHGLHGRLLAIVEIAGQYQRVDLLAKAKINDPHERLASSVSD
jgi:hypothetical protein